MNQEFEMLNQFEQESTLRFEPAHYQAQPQLPQTGYGLGLEGPQGQGYPSLRVGPQNQL